VVQRCRQINKFGRMLHENGTVICEIVLHISKDEQRVRLQKRLDVTTKHWKFDVGDLEVRRQWKQLPGRLRGSDRRHRHPLRAMDRGAGQLEDAPQPDDRHAD
jgi:hypothetical protein